MDRQPVLSIRSFERFEYLLGKQTLVGKREEIGSGSLSYSVLFPFDIPFDQFLPA